MGFGLAVGVLMQFFAEGAVSLFTDAARSDGAEVIRLGGQYLRGYVWDCLFAGMHFSFSGYFCACGKSILSFLQSILSIIFVRVPGAYFMSALFPDTLFPMGMATAVGSLVSGLICVVSFVILCRRSKAASQKPA